MNKDFREYYDINPPSNLVPISAHWSGGYAIGFSVNVEEEEQFMESNESSIDSGGVRSKDLLGMVAAPSEILEAWHYSDDNDNPIYFTPNKDLSNWILQHVTDDCENEEVETYYGKEY